MLHQEPVVEVINLRAHYGEREILHNVHMRVMPGEIRVILGSSGCGKTTLLKHLIGLAQPTEGVVKLLGIDLTTANPKDKDRLLGRVGMLFQSGALLNSLKLLDNVMLPLQERTNLTPVMIRDIAMMKLAQVGLEDFINFMPKELSGGMKKRAALARAMALDPEILFCDEPSAGLDPIHAAELDGLILNLRNQFGMTVVVVTHELASIRAIADHVTMLASGEVLADGPLTEIMHLETPMVQAFFNRQPSAWVSNRPSLLAALGK